ncbi:MAG TPA: ATP-binding protein [Vulgatibacter sp.]|nr:ATP-binding protein [Vulgatibacter sp.]
MKTEFFTNISHELRTPLSLILTPVESAIAKSNPEEDQQLLETIRRNAYRLLRLIDDLLDLSRIDAGRLRLNIAPVELPKLAENMVESFRPAAESRGIALSLEAPDEIADLFGDEHRLEMVLTNLIGNALKFTPDGGRIDVHLESDGGLVRMSVRDTGPGISAEDQKRIFDRFYRVEGPDRQQGGAGIGLSLARQLVEMHGGNLSVESEPGRGSKFMATIPLGRDHFRPEIIERRMVAVDMPGGRRASDWNGAEIEGDVLPQAPAADSPPEPPIELEGGRRARLVLVEDNDELRALIEGLLSPNFDVMTARDGVEGLSLVRKQRPDLVVSDVMMPRMSGTELCARIKKDLELKATPVILLTARSGPEAVLEGYAFGADDFVSKPLHPRILVARVRAQLRLRALSLQVLSHAKLAAVGTLAAGIGHEVRNPVNAVINGARTLLARDSLEPSARKLLEVIEDAASRIEAISGALLDHAHPGEQDRPRNCDVRAGIDATLRLLEHRARDVEIHRHYESERNVVASAGELNQVFMNLLDNAIRSSARNVWIRVADDADRLSVRIEDDGPGVPVEIAQRIFDPFFTTREPGVGTGLGLYLSNQIVSKYGGILHHEVRPGGGAIFTVDLPAEKTA